MLEKTKNVTLAVLILVAVCLPNKAIGENTNELYGFTANGIFYIHSDLIDAAGGGWPEITGGFTGRKRISMDRKGDYYIWQARTTGPYRFAQFYCFHIGGETYIPHALVDLGSPMINPQHVKHNPTGGYNFLTDPQEELPSALR